MAIVGFIGTGSMGSALARAAARSGVCETILLANRGREKAERLAVELGGEAVDNAEAAARSDILFLGVEPGEMRPLIESLRETLDRRKTPPLVVSMAAGKDLEFLGGWLGAKAPVIRIMPNIPAAVGAGVILYSVSKTVTPEQEAAFCGVLKEAGWLSRIEERLMGAAGSVTGCGPAFAALFAEALADGAVTCGVPRTLARAYAAETMLGTAKLLLDTGMSPAELKDRVCSPGGSTIQGVRAMEEGGVRAGVMNAVIAAFEKKF